MTTIDEYNSQNSTMKSDCPVCKTKDSLEITQRTDNIPYFGDVLETSVLCKECGYQTSDSICLEIKDPVKFTFLLSDKKLNTRVAKSPSATITIPELGLKVEPGSKSQGYVSNIEGILNRFEDAVVRAIKLEGKNIDSQTLDNATYILEQITNIKMGKLETTLILEDPFGHSVIDDEDATKTILSKEEAEKLESGFTTIDQ